jgi:hypothetical protein
MMHDDGDYEQIERLAYRFWQERGSPFGSPEEDWFRAEEHLRQQRPAAEFPFSGIAMEPIEEAAQRGARRQTAAA